MCVEPSPTLAFKDLESIVKCDSTEKKFCCFLEIAIHRFLYVGFFADHMPLRKKP